MNLLRRLVPPSFALLLGVAATGTAASAQPDAPAPLSSVVLRLPGKTVEVIGLNRWTVSMLQDSLARHAPGNTLGSHACAAALRYQLGFADAAAMGIRFVGDTTETVIISVVEPQDSARVKYRAVPMDTVSSRAEWAPAIRVVREKPWAFQAAAATYLSRADGVPPYLRRDSAEVAEIWAFLAARRGGEDAATAMRTLTLPDSSLHNRMVATAILLNFADRDPTWWTLAETMREEDGMVKGMAGTVLVQFARVSPRRVDWRPAAPTVHAILDGTSLFQLREMIEVLNATSADPALAPAFLAGGGRMLVAYAGAESEMVSRPARELLGRLSGHDSGRDRDRWAAWIHTLR